MALSSRQILSALTCLLLLAVGSVVHAQTTIHLFNAETSRFPLASARFFALDAARDIITGLSAADITLTENGIQRQVVALRCPDPKSPEPVTCGVMVDTYRHLDIAAAGLARIIARLKMPASEVGVTTMDKGVFIIQDLTIDPRRASSAIDRLISSPGTHLQQIMYDPNAGGVGFVSRRPNRKALVLFTDLHCPDFGLDTNRLWADAARERISVYTVLLHAGDYYGLFRRIGEKTGGRVFERVTSVAQVEQIMDEIALEMQHEPCTLEWITETGCDSVRNVTASLPSRGASGSGSYLLPKDLRPGLTIAPRGVFFDAVAPGTTRDTTITVTATRRDITIRSVVSDNPAFTTLGLPVTIPAGTSGSFTLRYTATDGNATFARLTVEHDACDPLLFYASAGSGVPAQPTLKVVSPNGGETLSVGTTALLTWTGVLPSDPVDLAYSTDDGAIWMPIADNVTGLEYLWRVPNTPSDRCLLRVTKTYQGSKPIRLVGQGGSIYWGEFSPDGRQVVTTGADNRKGVPDYQNSVWIWDAATGEKIRELTGQTKTVRRARYTPDGALIVTGGDDREIRIYDAKTGTLVRSIPNVQASPIYQLEITPDGRYVIVSGATAPWLARSIWEMATGEFVGGFATGASVRSMDISPDGRRIAVVNYNRAEIWDLTFLNSPTFLVQTADSGDRLNSVAFDPGGGLIATGSETGNVRVWDAISGELIETPSFRPRGVSMVAFDPTGESLLVAGPDSLAIIIGTVGGREQQRLRGHKGPLNSAGYSLDGSRVLTTSWDSTAIIWSVDAIGEDRSDTRWTIAAPRLEIPITEIDMGTALVHGGRDSMVMMVLCNRGNAPLRIAGIDATSGDVGAFSILSGGGEFVLEPGECRDIHFMFHPMMMGHHFARFSIRLDNSTLANVIKIFGMGEDRRVEIMTRTVDFAGVRVGATADTVVDVVLRNSGTAPFSIDASTLLGPDTVQFSILSGGGSFTLAPGATHTAQIRFAPVGVGRTSGRMAFHYAGPGSPAEVSLFGEGIGPEIVLTADSIPFDLLCSSQHDSVVMIYNSGNADLTINEILLDGSAATGFSLTLPTGVVAPIVLAPRASVRGVIRYAPGSTGSASSNLRLRSDALNAVAGETVLPIRGSWETTGLAISMSRVDMLDLAIGSPVTTTFDLTNTGSLPLSWTAPFSLGPHVVDIVPTVTPPGGVSTVTVRFPGGAEGDLFTDTLRFTTLCDTALVPVVAAVQFAARADLAAGEVSAEPGEIIEIPVLLRDAHFITRSGATSFETTLRFNASMLLPVDGTPLGTVINGERVIPLTMPATGSADGTLLTLRFRVALGDDTITALTLEDSRSIGGSVALRERAGAFHLNGVCLLGGAGLVRVGDGIMLKVLPNPASSTAEITIHAVESGDTRITLVDLLGRRVATAFDGPIEPGTYRFTVDLSELAPGMYYCMLRTATEEVVEQVKVAR